MLMARERRHRSQSDSFGILSLIRPTDERPELGRDLALRRVIFGGEALDPRRRDVGTSVTRWRSSHDQYVRHHRDDGACGHILLDRKLATSGAGNLDRPPYSRTRGFTFWTVVWSLYLLV